MSRTNSLFVHVVLSAGICRVARDVFKRQTGFRLCRFKRRRLPFLPIANLIFILMRVLSVCVCVIRSPTVTCAWRANT